MEHLWSRADANDGNHPQDAVLAEQTDEWAVTRRYMSAESIAKALTDPPTDEPEELIAIAEAA